jgi:hypothetical protein
MGISKKIGLKKKKKAKNKQSSLRYIPGGIQLQTPDASE